VIGVEFHFTADQQTRLARIAEQEGIDVATLIIGPKITTLPCSGYAIRKALRAIK